MSSVWTKTAEISHPEITGYTVFAYICQFEYNFVKQDLITQALLCMHSLICGAMYTQHLLLFPI